MFIECTQLTDTGSTFEETVARSERYATNNCTYKFKINPLQIQTITPYKVSSYAKLHCTVRISGTNYTITEGYEEFLQKIEKVSGPKNFIAESFTRR